MIITTNTNVEIPTLPGREYQVSGLGTWDGATVTLQTFADGAWRAVPDGTYSADFGAVYTNGAGTELRLAVTNAGDETALSVTLTELP
jgi:hypothetical protein